MKTPLFYALAFLSLSICALPTAKAAPGDLDPNFNGGTVRTGFGFGNDVIHSTVLQPDGKIVVAGYAQDNAYDFALARYNPDGTLDTSFDGDGTVTTDFAAGTDDLQAIALQGDGKIVAAGRSSVGGSFSSDVALVRYHANGSLDTSFGGDGKVTTDFGTSDDRAYAIVVQPDGKIVVAGNAQGDFALARYNPDGSLDTSFGNGGKVVTDFASGIDGAYALAIQPDGKIVAAGKGFAVEEGISNFALARYHVNGLLDSSFDGDGKVLTDFAQGTDLVKDLVIQGDGKIVAAGSSESADYDIALVRYNTNGSLDTSFDEDGKVTTVVGAGDDFGEAVLLQGDGKIVVVGRSFNGANDDFVVARYLSNGAIDPAFGYANSPVVVTRVGTNEDQAFSAVLQPDGMIIAAGQSTRGSYNFALVRYDADGLVDISFGSGGAVITDVGNNGSRIQGVAIQSDGKIVAVGSRYNGFAHAFAVVRYNPDGSLDMTFGDAGKVTTPIGPSNSSAQAVAIQSDKKIVVVGSSGTGADFTVARYHPDGTLDLSFDGDGIATTPVGGGSDFASAVIIQPDGKIVVAGDVAISDSNHDFGLVRYKPNGSLDTSFDGDGKVITPFGGYDAAGAIALQSDGKLVVAGSAQIGISTDFALARYNSDGSLDPSFSGDGKVTTNVGTGVDFANSVAVQSDGKIVAAGNGYVSPSTDFALVRFDANGELDDSFDGDGKVTTDFGGQDDHSGGIALQPDGKIVVAGNTFAKNRDFAVARYRANGSLDASFSGDGKATIDFGGADDVANALALDDIGRIVLAGHAGDLFGVARFLGDVLPPPTGSLLNISTRLRVGTGENVLIGGFIVTGNEPKKVIIRAIGPSLGQQGVAGALENPTLDLIRGDKSIAFNNNWKDSQPAAIQDTGVAPTHALESAIVRTLQPGSYTAIMRGAGGTSGVGLVEVYDLAQGAQAQLVNISTRGLVQTGDNVMIGGFIVGGGGGGPTRVIVRAIGPSLGAAGVQGALQDPTLSLVNSNGVVVRANDNWKDSQRQAIQDSGIKPSDDRESALIEVLNAGGYTAIVRGKGNTTGVGLVEVYNVP